MDLEVDVGWRGAGVAGAADEGDRLAHDYVLADRHEVPLVVRVVVAGATRFSELEGDSAKAVVGVAGAVDHSALDRNRSRAFRCEQVVALVLAPA